MTEACQLPAAFAERLAAIVPPARLEEVLRSFSQERPVFFRLHKSGAEPEAVIASVREAGLEAETVSEIPGTFVLKKGTVRELQQTPFYREGFIYLQGLSSLAVPWVLGARPGERVLDLTAAPGSKTTQIARGLQGQGSLTANDVSRERFYKMKAIVEAQGFSNVKVMLGKGEFLWRREPEAFDRVLLDAPCSSEGRMSLLDRDSLRYWKLSKIKEMANKQRGLILSAFGALKPGGILVYSTCTFAPEENEVLLSWALQKFGETAAVEPAGLPWPAEPGLASWEGRALNPELQKAARILPDVWREAFFICKIRKIQSWLPKPILPAGEPVHERKFRKRR